MPFPHRKIIITGTGRAGTTFLVQLFTELGLDTGYTPQTWQQDYDFHCAAGLEHDLSDPTGPRIVKNPAFCETLPGLLRRGDVAVEHAIIPVRSLDEAAQSRIRVGGSGKTPGGLTGTDDPANQKAALAENFHRLVHTLAAHDIPHTFLDFPRFVRDPVYTWEKLQWLVGETGREKFFAAFASTARPDLIHNFSPGLTADAGEPARQYDQRRRRRRWWRHVERSIVWALMAGMGWLAAVCWLAAQGG